jgi:hypothetical protein
MARRVFFSFHYERDILRVGQVRNSWVTKPTIEEAGYTDSASWESLKRQGDNAVKRWINSQLDGTSVTVVLIGAETSTRDWVKYEIKQSYSKGNGLLGIYIHNIKDLKTKQTDSKGKNVFGEIGKDENGNSVYFYQVAHSYDWVNDDGYNNLGDWIEEAARNAGR